MNHRHAATAALPLAVLVALTGCDWQRFRKDIFAGERPYDLIAGDFNGDGRPDLAVTTWEGLVVLLNEGRGDFRRQASNETVRDLVVVGDFDGDGRDDLASRESILLSQGDGNFVTGQPTGSLPLAAGDFNLDGRSDLLLGDDDGVRIWVSNGDGTFQPAATVIEGQARQAVVADLNGDGHADVAVLPVASPSLPLRVLLGRGDGTFGAEISTPIDALGLLAADFNGDGLPDLATQGCVFCEAGKTEIALGRGDGSFQSLAPYSLNGSILLAAADLDGDGWADLVSGGDTRNSVSVYAGLGNGTFDEWTDVHSVGWGPRAAVALDLNEDDRPDLVTANFSANTVSVLLAGDKLTVDDESFPFMRRAVSTASGTAIVAPESLATLIAPTTAAIASAFPPWLTSLGGISLEVRDSAGETRLAQLGFVSSGQINFQVPAGTASGEATLFVAGWEMGSMQIHAVAPGLFMTCPEKDIPSATWVVVEPDGAQVPMPVFRNSDGSCGAEPIPLSSAGNRPVFLSFYGTGFRGATPENVTCSINGMQQYVDYAGPQGGTPGLDQINVRLTPELLVTTEEGSFGPGPVTVTLRINGVAANSAVIDVR